MDLYDGFRFFQVIERQESQLFIKMICNKNTNFIIPDDLLT